MNRMSLDTNNKVAQVGVAAVQLSHFSVFLACGRNTFSVPGVRRAHFSVFLACAQLTTKMNRVRAQHTQKLRAAHTLESRFLVKMTHSPSILPAEI